MNPQLIDDMSWRMAEVYGAVKDRILINLAHYFPFIRDADEVKGAFQYQARMLAQMGQVTRETIDIIAGSLGGADEALRMSLEIAIRDSLRAEDPKLQVAVEKGLLDAAAVPEMDAGQTQAFQAFYRQSADKLNLVNTVMLESTLDAYQDTVAGVTAAISRTQGILNEATGELITSVSAWNSAVRSGVQKMVENGITGFIDHGGHHWSPEAYVAMDTRTTMFNSARAAVWERMEQYNIDTYQVSTKLAARPLCYPWQGKVISREDRARDVTDGDGNTVHVYAQSETTYGEPAGLFGINCGHHPLVFIPGVSTVKPPLMTEEENAAAYALTQKQRHLERTLREEKRDLEVLKAQGATDEEIDRQKARVQQASNEIADFCEENGLPRDRSRETAPVDAQWTEPDGTVVRRFGGEYVPVN